MNQEDRTFLKYFSYVIVGLMVFTVVIAVLALVIHKGLTPSENPAREAMKLARIQPVATVYSGDTGRAALAEARAANAQEQEVAFDGSTDPGLIYNNVCAACHTTGAAEAPVLEPTDWSDRLPKGMETLIDNAIDGIGVMPPKGGRPDLTEEQVAVTVEWMVEQVR